MQLLQFIDLGGHEKYLKTALFGMTCLMPDYVILTVAANRGLDKPTLEHLAAAMTLQLPTVIVLTKVGLSKGCFRRAVQHGHAAVEGIVL